MAPDNFVGRNCALHCPFTIRGEQPRVLEPLQPFSFEPVLVAIFTDVVAIGDCSLRFALTLNAAAGGPNPGRMAGKKFKKTQKKACQPLASSARQEIRATNSPVWPFKKSLKKVKKKLVRALEI